MKFSEFVMVLIALVDLVRSHSRSTLAKIESAVAVHTNGYA